MRAGVACTCAWAAPCGGRAGIGAKTSCSGCVTLGRVEQTADQLPSPSARFAANPQLSGKYGGHTLNLHQFARNGVVLLGRLVGVDGHRIALAPDLQENLANADKASEDFKQGVDAFVRRTGMDVPEPEPDPVDEVRSDAGRHAPATLDLKAAGITTVIWATGYGFDYSWVHLPVCDDVWVSGAAARRHEVPGALLPGHELSLQPQVRDPARRRRRRRAHCRRYCRERIAVHVPARLGTPSGRAGGQGEQQSPGPGRTKHCT